MHGDDRNSRLDLDIGGMLSTNAFGKSLSAIREVTTIHRLLLRMSSLDIWLRSAALLWRLYYSSGRLESRAEKTRGHARIHDFDPISKAFCNDFSGWLEATVESSGKANVVTQETHCVLDGHDFCHFEGSWR